MNVLAIGCHPDDIEIACAGTLAKFVKQGHNVTVCHVANGDMGHVEIMPPELRAMRIEEAKKAGAMAGIKVVTCDIGDLVVYSDDRTQRDKVVDVIRAAQPDLIITHSPDDYMPDHVIAVDIATENLLPQGGHQAYRGRVEVCVDHHVSNDGYAREVTPIYYMDTLAGVGFTPEEYVDVSEFIDLKLSMLECHVSQMKWMREHDHIDFAEFVKTCARFRGLQCGVQYAEAFSVCRMHGKVVPARLLP